MISLKRNVVSPMSALIIATIALLIGVALGAAAAGDNVLPGDVRIATTIQDADGRVFEVLADIGNLLGTTLWAAIAMSLALGVAMLLRARPEALYLGTLLVLRLMGTQLKPLFSSPRPTDDLVQITGIHDGTGYPSGHSLTAATLALGLAVLAWRYMPSRGWALVSVTGLIGLGLLVGWARIWTGAHWPSDVLGGYAFGVVTVAIGVMVLERQENGDRRLRRRWVESLRPSTRP